MDWEDICGVPNPFSPMIYDVYRAGNGPVPQDPCLGLGSALQCLCQQRLQCVLCQDAGRHTGSKCRGKWAQPMAGHTEQNQRKFLPCYPRTVKAEPTQHILGISKGILGLLAFFNKREVWSGGTLMSQ